MRLLPACLTALATLAAAITQAYAQAEPDALVYHKLSTQFRGPGMPLDVFNGGPQNNKVHLTRNQDVSGQYWAFVPMGDGFYRLKTMFRGSGMCLDIDPGTNQPELRPCGNYSGQFWRLETARSGMRLTTQFRGPGQCLDVEPSTNQPELRPCGNYSGQFWRFDATDKPVR